MANIKKPLKIDVANSKSVPEFLRDYFPNENVCPGESSLT
jgi:hypothetical protein